MELGIKKCGVLVLKRGKVDKAKRRGLNLPNGKVMKTIDEEGYKRKGNENGILLDNIKGG